MRAAVEDVHHRHRQHVRVRAADVAEQRQVGGVGGGVGDGERDAEDRVGAELAPCWACRRGRASPGRRAAARSASKPISAGPISSMTASTAFCDALAAVAVLVAVAQLDRLEARRWRRRRERPRGRSCRRRGRPRPRRWGCRASRGSRGRRRLRCWPRRTPGALGDGEGFGSEPSPRRPASLRPTRLPGCRPLDRLSARRRVRRVLPRSTRRDHDEYRAVAGDVGAPTPLCESRVLRWSPGSHLGTRPGVLGEDAADELGVVGGRRARGAARWSRAPPAVACTSKPRSLRSEESQSSWR